MSEAVQDAGEGPELPRAARPPATEGVFCVKSPRDGKLGLACVARRTYALGPRRLALADVQDPLVLDPVVERDAEGEYRTLLDDTDVIGVKHATDVVVTGTAHAPGPVTELPIAVAAGRSARVLRVVGERRVEVREDGSARFTPPTPFERVPLVYDLAYGGHDVYAQRELGPRRRPGARPRRGLFGYPRNPVGRGYFLDVDRERAHGALLPMIEDPADPLTPERLFVPAPLAWIDAPVAAGLGWVAHGWYPRQARFMGPTLMHRPPARPIREAQLGDGDDLVDLAPLDAGKVLPRCIQGAPPGLACERLRGDEAVILRNLHPAHPDLRFSLPGEAPRFSLRVPGVAKVFTPAPVLQTVRIAPDRGTVSLTWCGVVRLLAAVDSDFLGRCEVAARWARG